MSDVAVEQLTLELGEFALLDISLSLDAGEIGVILGPNGAGKSVLLETIAGFHRPAAGRVVISGREVTTKPPEQRHVGFILQNFGLFPHLTAAENISFGLHIRRRQRGSGEIAPLLARFRLEGVADRLPDTLSPGEKQRTALARSLITEPDVFLLDEPFAAIDTRTSDTLREELRQFIRDARIPALFVTHDHLDAVALADKIAVMWEGEIVQSGTPSEVFQRPKNRFVAEFLGVENILAGTIMARHAGGYSVYVGGQRLEVPPGNESLNAEDEVLLCLPADAVDVRQPGGAASLREFPGLIVAMASAGPLVRLTLDCGFPLTAHLLRRTVSERHLQPHQAVTVDIDPAAVHLIREP
ncbi:MAG TPA: ABC transporter ATP-binding protein [Alphaproteobacteria bacterium]|nr:ABC transporter ATP-binding protein [Alphaproteobacteria bacterium]